MSENEKDKSPKPHFWIPDSEVDSVVYTPTSRPTPLNIDHREHGTFLQTGITGIKRFHQVNQTPISDEVIIFKVQLADGEKADARGDYEALFVNNNLKINSIKKSNVAIVSSTPSNLDALSHKLNQYKQRNGGSYDFFQHIKSFSRYDSSEKRATELDNADGTVIDVQIKLVPNLTESMYQRMLEFLYEQIEAHQGKMLDTIVLHNNTPVIRALVSSSGLTQLSDQEIVLDIGMTPFFGVEAEGGGRTTVDLNDVVVEYPSDPREMPVICVLDDGVVLPDIMNDCIAGRFVSSDIKRQPTRAHGTKVASRAIFGDNIDMQVRDKLLVPKIRVIDAVISEGRSSIDEPTLIKRIREAVEAIKEQTRIFCLAMNELAPISGDYISNIAYELDSLARIHKVQFVVPSGNHFLWTVHPSIAHIIDDDSARMAAPGDSLYALTIGSVTRDDHLKSMSQKNQLSPFSRIGFGFAGSAKPDLVYPGGNLFLDSSRTFIPANCAAYVINNSGLLEQEFGTSFSVPIAAQELALLSNEIEGNDLEIAKVLLLHHAETPQIDSYNGSQELRELYGKIYGKGIGNYLNAKDSLRSRATYIRKGSMSRLTKQRVRFHMPTTIAQFSNRGTNVVKVSVTSICLTPVDHSMGYEYQRAFIETSLHKLNSNNNLITDNPPGKEGRSQWENIHHFNRVLSSFNPGDWQIWLQLYTKPELANDAEVEYVLILTIEDLTTNDVDIHGGISVETMGRFELLSEVQVGIDDFEEQH